MLILNKTAGVFFKPSRRKIYAFLGSFHFHPGKLFLHKLVLGIETSCDDTAAAVVDEAGNVLGEAIHSQTEVHLKTGGIIPPVAQQLHRENIQRIVQEALSASEVSPSELSAIATTIKPGLALSLGVSSRGRSCLQLQTLLLRPSTPWPATLQKEHIVLFCSASREASYVRVTQYWLYLEASQVTYISEKPWKS
uniref:N(6)-L-threonylcarbamoyladenine synthase n=1 Tax=Bos mutus grunniens TaxID=30521 RepID=A0A8B9WF79_BOSMU